MFRVGSRGHRRPSRRGDVQIEGMVDSLMEGGGQSGGGRAFGQKDRVGLVRYRHTV